MSSNTLVLGAGELGLPVLRNLARGRKPGERVAVLLRPVTIASQDPAKRREVSELRDLGVELLPGDLAAEPEADLAARFRDFDTVIGCTGFAAGRGAQRKLARAVLGAGVRRYVPWQFGVDYDVIGRGSAQDLFDEQLDVRDLLRSQARTEWVIVSTGMFTSFLFEPSFGVVDLTGSVVRALGGWGTAVTVTTPEDIGALTAAVLRFEPQVANRVVYTAGDTITYGQLADTVDRVLGRELRREVWSVSWLKEELAREPGDALRKYRVVFAEGRGVSWDPALAFNTQQGIAVTNVARWAAEHLK